MPKEPIDPRQALRNNRHELLAHLLSTGRMKPAEAYQEAGYKPQDDKAARDCCSYLLRNLKNGVQARVDFLCDQIARKRVEKVVLLDARRLEQQDALEDEVDRMRNELWNLATTPRPKLTPSGKPVLYAGEIVMEIPSFPAAVKLCEMNGVDAGRLVRQSRSGAMDGDYKNMTTEEIAQIYNARMEEFGLKVVRADGTEIEPVVEPEPGKPGIAPTDRPQAVHPLEKTVH